MKRFIALCAFAVATSAIHADAQQMNGKNTQSSGMCSMINTATSAADETWTQRTQVSATFFGKAMRRPYWEINTIQPLMRTDGTMENTLFAQVDLGARKWEDPRFDIGVGYRYLAASNQYLMGANVFFDRQSTHSRRSMSVGAEFLGEHFTLRGNYYFGLKNRFGVATMTSQANPRIVGNIDMNFQLPFLPWTTASIGPVWARQGDRTNVKWKYALRLNIAGPLAIETGFNRNWGSGGYAKIAFNFGRSAVTEHTLADAGIYAHQAFTARDLKNYTLDRVGRHGWIR